jgi:hypothetical protein
MGDDASMIRFLDAKIEMFLAWMHARKGKQRDTATVAEIAIRFKVATHEVEQVMKAAHGRGLIDIYSYAGDKVFVLRSTI